MTTTTTKRITTVLTEGTTKRVTTAITPNNAVRASVGDRFDDNPAFQPDAFQIDAFQAEDTFSHITRRVSEPVI